jgi:hypothetical protein
MRSGAATTGKRIGKARIRKEGMQIGMQGMQIGMQGKLISIHGKLIGMQGKRESRSLFPLLGV